ncbi:DEAD/DEAH box helicase [Roseivivax sp. GX 12232]|uniref:DEAD/DEAH box helicase n=1 Tax=Roseivivax sp. GX 12232 TaxID=2900547 RepID=UPI001E33E7CE|nr:DEAD/DEAH box helicase [Roseivivax sp. GX 12232]MCE0504342.1 DEAD/DEAH box helicase [Roseivivax sp. GX 12232]
MLQPLSDALAERGYDTLTPVQEAVTDPALAEADLLVSAQTGSGKTVGFGLAIGPTLLGDAETLDRPGIPLALIVAPTRELAFQVTRELDWLYARTGARVTACVGGMDMRAERRALEAGAHIVVGTPGRLVDHIRRGALDLSGLRAVVLDEADEMLDLGFREDLEFMLGEAPETRRTLLFSATVPPAIVTLAQHYQREAVRVTTLSERGQHADIAYQALQVAPQDAETAIINVLRFHEAQNAIVFANTRATVNRLTARFANRGFQVVCLSGELSQAERSHALQAMRDGRARVCVATDVAARGIDLPNLELVIHAELPTNAEGLLHRSGRTGRAGRKGLSALIVPPKLTKRAERLLKSARVSAEWTQAPGAEEILRRDEERLLADPTWQEAISEEEAGFATRLLENQSPEAVAAAYLRLYRQSHSAPEELSDPEARPAPKARAPFGPSAWVALSVGRDQRAEPRWILPLLLRAGGLDKAAIGAIRVQPRETFVEIAEPALPLLMEKLGAEGEIEEGLRLRLLDGAPDLDRPAPAPRDRKPRPERGDRFEKGDRPARGERFEKSDRPARGERFEKSDRPARSDRFEKSDRPARGDRFEKGDRPARGDRFEKSDRPARKDRFDASERPQRKPRPAQGEGEARSAGPRKGKPTDKGEGRGAPWGPKPRGKGPQRPMGAKPKPGAKRPEQGEAGPRRGKPKARFDR